MKLSARKSMVALGTALSLSLAPVAVPSFAPVAYAASVSKSNYRSEYDSVPLDIKDVDATITKLGAKLNSDSYKRSTDDANYGEAVLKKDAAVRALDAARSLYTDLQNQADKGKVYTADNAEVLRSALDRIADARSRVSEANVALGRVFVCDTEGTTKDTKDGQDAGSTDSLSSGDSSDSLSSALGSSKNVVVTKDGKKYCKKVTEKWVDQLSSFAKILGVVLSVITAVAALNNAVVKNNPLAPKK